MPVFLVFGRAPIGPKTQAENHTKTGPEGQRKRALKDPFFARILGCFRGLLGVLELPQREGQKMVFRRLILGAPAVLIAAPVQATPLPRYGLFVFSSLCTDHMTSDLNGDRLVLVRLPLHDFGFMEGGDGGFVSAPIRDLKIDDKSGEISFRYRDEDAKKPDAMKSVASTISAESVGLMSWNGKPFRLMRLQNPGQKFPICH